MQAEIGQGSLNNLGPIMLMTLFLGEEQLKENNTADKVHLSFKVKEFRLKLLLLSVMLRFMEMQVLIMKIIKSIQIIQKMKFQLLKLCIWVGSHQIMVI